jgi:ubiquinone/menaquinone biosynthesis C-methylase UbiE
MSALVNGLYNNQSIQQWQNERTMLHSSGIWGRGPVLEYLANEVVNAGDIVIDLGAGAGYPTLQIAGMTGAAGNVIGIELSEAMLKAARSHCRAANLSFRRGDISQPLPLEDKCADVVTGLMVLHNLHRAEMRRTLSEVERVLKPGGRAVFLTMHPDAFESQWDLQFLSYDLSALQRYRNAVDKEDTEVLGRARNISGGEKAIAAIYHSRRSVVEAVSDAGLVLTDERNLWIDLETAVQMFGTGSIRRMPTTPTYWMLTLAKSSVVANGHADGALRDSFISAHQPVRRRGRSLSYIPPGAVPAQPSLEQTALMGDHQMFSLSSSKATLTQQLDSPARLSRRTTRPVKIISVAAVALLAAANTFASAEQDPTRTARKHHACAVIMGLHQPGDLYDTCIRSLEKTLSELDQAKLVSTNRTTCAREGLKPGSPAFAVCVVDAERSPADAGRNAAIAAVR